MEVLVKLTIWFVPIACVVVIRWVSVSLLNFLVKRCQDEGMEVEVEVMRGVEN